MKKETISIVCASLVLAGCATSPSRATPYLPVIDTGMAPAGRNFQRDVHDCNGFAEQRLSAAQAAAAGAVMGALLGAALGAAAGGGSRFQGRMAGVGAISGSTGAGAGAQNNRESIVRNCMGGRGWAVLG